MDEIGSPASPKLQRRVLYAALLSIWAAALVLAGGLIILGEVGEHQQSFSAYADAYHHDIANKLHTNEALLDGITAVLSASGNAGNRNPTAYANQILGRYPYIARIQVFRRTTRRERDSLVKQISSDFGRPVNVRTFDYDQQRTWRPVGDKTVYYLATFEAPKESNASQSVLGLDAYSVPFMRDAVEKALDTQTAYATPPFRLLDGQTGYMVLSPVLSTSGPAPAIVALVMEGDSLIPSFEESLRGLRIRLLWSPEDIKGPGKRLYAEAGEPLSFVQRAGFPVERYQRRFDVPGQPLVLQMEQHLGWFIIPWPLRAAYLLGAALLLFALFAYGEQRLRRDAERERAARRLFYMANFDSLTGLPNRNLFRDRLHSAIARERRQGGRLAVLFLDLDDFKAVHDTAGHEAGDWLLAEVAERLRNAVREEDTVARLSGDEFVVLLEEIASAEGVAELLAKLKDALEVPYHIRDDEFQLTISAGSALFPDDGVDPSELLRVADQAMYAGKRSRWRRQSPLMVPAEDPPFGG